MYNIRSIILISFFMHFVFSSASLAGIDLGFGTNSFTAGRVVPAIDIGYSETNNFYSWNSSGVKNSYYYQTAHHFAYYQCWTSGTLWGGNMISGFGGGIAYVIRSFKDYDALNEEKKSDFIVGPAIRMNWSFGFIFINMSATFGLKDLYQHISGLTFQDVETISLGVRF